MPRYSGKWNLTEQMQAIGASNWPSPPIIRVTYAAGNNSYGGFGLNNVVNRSSPVQISAGLTQIESTGANSGANMAVNKSGQLWAIGGSNGYGAFGLGDTVQRSSPVQVGALTNWSKVVVNAVTTCHALKTDGTWWAWGYGEYGPHNDRDNRNSPVQVGTDTDWADIFFTTFGAIVIKTNGDAYVYGRNLGGALGDGTTTTRSSPIQIGSGTAWAKGSGTNSALLVSTGGALYACGLNGSGDLGLNNITDQTSLQQVGSLTNWSTPSMSDGGTSCTTTDGAVFTWGNNFYGSLAHNDVIYRSSPVQVTGSWSHAAITGNGTFYGINTSGELFSCGRNENGEPGLNIAGGAAGRRSSPIQVGSKTDYNGIYLTKDYQLLVSAET